MPPVLSAVRAAVRRCVPGYGPVRGPRPPPVRVRSPVRRGRRRADHGDASAAAGCHHGRVIAITRFSVPDDEAGAFAERATAVLTSLAACPGHRRGRLGRSVDDPSLWALVTEWDGAGFYRRALSAYDVRLTVIPLSALAIDEPGAYELVPPATGEPVP